ncbi:hypothetical protein P308_25805 [Pseudomonas piscis]|nr:hypothetical protein P308_25805 [Pseudomonas piscis]
MWVPQLSDFNQPVYLSIADALQRDIGSGLLKDGERLPTLRELAVTLNVTPGTINRAYGEAQRRGLVQGEVGRGTYVLGRAPLALAEGAAGPSLALGQSEALDLSLIKPYSETLEYWLRGAWWAWPAAAISVGPWTMPPMAAIRPTARRGHSGCGIRCPRPSGNKW